MGRMKELVELLNAASKAYYNEDREILSNIEYDRLYDELESLENETGIVLPNSPTQSAGIQAVSELKKVEHEYPALSLKKTKVATELVKWANQMNVVLSFKLDGLTCICTYSPIEDTNESRLIRVETRGSNDDNIGEDITHNAIYFKGIPQTIPYSGHLVVRGEAAITYSEWERINNLLPEDVEPYGNARNVASGTVRALNPSICKDRQVVFSAFKLENTDNLMLDERYDVDGTYSSQMMFLADLGINTVAWEVVEPELIEEKIDEWSKKVETAQKSSMPGTSDIPVDGLVFTFEDTVYGDSLGSTGHHARSGMAFKWEDALYTSTIKEIFWSASKSSLNPVAIFDTVNINNTEVSRASVHNVSILKKLGIVPGSTVSVYLANLIIPQICENLGDKVEITYPDVCPVCGSPTSIRIGKDGTETLYCTNHDCAAKHLADFVRFVGKDAMNIVGIAAKQISQLISEGFLHSLVDFYNFGEEDYKRIATLDCWGKKSVDNLRNSIENSMKVRTEKFLYSLGIHNFGHDATKKVAQEWGFEKFDSLLKSGCMDLTTLDGVGNVINTNVIEWFSVEKNRKLYDDLILELMITDPEKKKSSDKLKGLTFVITGSLVNYTNRDELKAEIESFGGKVSSAVSGSTSYLITNERSSTGKYKKAKELGITIFSEEDYIKMVKL